jgi:hypothetical protein
MSVPLWLFLAAAVWAAVASVFLLYRNPLPFPDRGHRCFGVRDDAAARAVASILGEIGGLPERFTFDSPGVRQTLMWDNATVLLQLAPATRDLVMARNGISVPVATPLECAREAATLLQQSGFSAVVREGPEVGLDDKLVVLQSDAFEGWVMVFRRHALAMGKIKTWKLL